MKIYDCFLFFNELELLDLRLNILKDVVDYFVIVESTVTFTSKPKKLIYEENKELFKEFEDKIIHVIIDDSPNNFSKINYITPETTESDVLKNKVLKYVHESTGWNHSNPNDVQWGVETYQRESIINGLINCDDDDIIIISDIDEIPNPIEVDKLIKSPNEVCNFLQTMYFYYFNLLKEKNWSGPKSCNWGKLKNISLNHLRQNKFTTKVIENGGWHFSFMGGESKIIEKIEAYGHQEFNNNFYKDKIISNMDNNTDPFLRGQLIKVDIDDSYPEYLLNNLDKYKHMIK